MFKMKSTNEDIKLNSSTSLNNPNINTTTTTNNVFLNPTVLDTMKENMSNNRVNAIINNSQDNVVSKNSNNIFNVWSNYTSKALDMMKKGGNFFFKNKDSIFKKMNTLYRVSVFLILGYVINSQFYMHNLWSLTTAFIVICSLLAMGSYKVVLETVNEFLNEDKEQMNEQEKTTHSLYLLIFAMLPFLFIPLSHVYDNLNKQTIELINENSQLHPTRKKVNDAIIHSINDKNIYTRHSTYLTKKYGLTHYYYELNANYSILDSNKTNTSINHTRITNSDNMTKDNKANDNSTTMSSIGNNDKTNTMKQNPNNLNHSSSINDNTDNDDRFEHNKTIIHITQ